LQRDHRFGAVARAEPKRSRSVDRRKRACSAHFDLERLNFARRLTYLRTQRWDFKHVNIAQKLQREMQVLGLRPTDIAGHRAQLLNEFLRRMQNAVRRRNSDEATILHEIAPSTIFRN
jgi:hypothetical protein